MSAPDLTVRLETPRLWLCDFRREDLDVYHAWLCSPDLARLLPVPAPIPRELAAEVLEQILTLPVEQGVHYAIWRRDTHEPIGSIGLGHRDLAGGHAGLSVGIAVPSARRQGLGTEATIAVLDHGFDGLGLRKVWLQHHGPNHAVHEAARRGGFVEVGRQRAHALLDGAHVDWVTMELFADAYRAVRPRLAAWPAATPSC